MKNFFEYIKSNSSFAKLSFDELLFAEYKCPIKEKKTPVWSNANYVAYVLSGRKIWSEGEVAYELKEGDAIFVSKGAHYIEQIMSKEFCLLIFFFPDEFLEDAIEQAEFTKHKGSKDVQKLIPVEMNEPLQIYFHSMASIFAQEKNPSKALLSLKFKELILQLLNYQKNPALFKFFDAFTSSPERRFRFLIDSNLQYNLSIEEYAILAGMSVSSFKRFFKQVYGNSPGQYILDKKLSYASMLLKKSEKNVQEVAYESGFESAAHFTRMFSKRFKASPTRYRNRNS